VLVSTVGILARTNISISAQDVTETPVPPEGEVPNNPESPDEQATRQAIEAQQEAEFNAMSIFDYRVAYLIAADAVTPDSLVSEAAFEQVFGSKVFNTWEAFADANADAPFQIILIHKSMVEQVDTTWTQWAYRNRVILVSISMTLDQYIEITGDRCNASPTMEYFEKFENTWLYYAYVFDFDDDERKAYVDQQKLEACNENLTFEDVGRKTGSVYQVFANMEITRPEALNELVKGMKMEIIVYEMGVAKEETLPLPNS
jgi:hypothetical protein